MPPADRHRNQPGEGSRLRQELIEAASRVLASAPDGAGLSLRAVAREAGVAAPSVYLQFDGKADLITAVLSDHFDRLRVAIIDAMATYSDPASRLRAGCIAYCRFGLDHPGPYHILFEHKPDDDRPLRPFGGEDDPGIRAFATLVDAIQACIDEGTAAPGDSFRIAAAVWSAMHGYVSLVRVRPGFPWQPLGAHIEDLLVGLVGVGRRHPAPTIRQSPANDAS